MLRRFGLVSEDSFLQWDHDHDWQKLVHDYDESHTIENIESFYSRIINDGVCEDVRRIIPRESLKNDEQRRAHDLCVRSCLLEGEGRLSQTDGGDDVHRLQIVVGEGGTGKSYVIDAIVTTLTTEYGFDECHIALFAPTGIYVLNCFCNNDFIFI